jgi:hypothetical protein
MGHPIFHFRVNILKLVVSGLFMLACVISSQVVFNKHLACCMFYQVPLSLQVTNGDKLFDIAYKYLLIQHSELCSLYILFEDEGQYILTRVVAHFNVIFRGS